MARAEAAEAEVERERERYESITSAARASLRSATISRTEASSAARKTSPSVSPSLPSMAIPGVLEACAACSSEGKRGVTYVCGRAHACHGPCCMMIEGVSVYYAFFLLLCCVVCVCVPVL